LIQACFDKASRMAQMKKQSRMGRLDAIMQ